jgi:hypothetical protein
MVTHLPIYNGSLSFCYKLPVRYEIWLCLLRSLVRIEIPTLFETHTSSKISIRMPYYKEDQVLVTYTIGTMHHDIQSTTKAGLFFHTAVYHVFTKTVSRWVKIRVPFREHIAIAAILDQTIMYIIIRAY